MYFTIVIHLLPFLPYPCHQCTIAVTLHPTASPLDALSSMSIKPGTLFKLVSDPEFMCHVTLAVCGYRVEEKELSSLPESLKGLLKEGMAVSTVESQFKALELLSWMVGVHLSNANRYSKAVFVHVHVYVGVGMR